MRQYVRAIRKTALLCSVIATSVPALAADVTPERLVNADKEPQNWLMNHRTYDGQRFSPLARINKDNVKNLKLAYAVPLGGGAGNEFTEATPLVEDGFLYITDSWGVLYKIDATSGDVGRIVWRMDPKQERQARNRGAALWGNLVITRRQLAGAHHRHRQGHRQGRVGNQRSPTRRDVTHHRRRRSPSRTRSSSAPPTATRACATGSRRSMPRPASVLWRKFTIPAPGEPGSETWKGNNNAWQTGGGAVWVTGTYDPATNQTIWGTGNPVPMFDPTYRPGDNLYTNSAISWDPDTGKMNWYFQYTPGDMWDYDEVGTHILIDGEVAGQPRKLITHSARNGFLYTMERANGADGRRQALHGSVNWTKGIDQKTGKPLDYDPTKDIQTYAGVGNLNPSEPLKKVCPSHAGGNNYWPSLLQPEDQAALHPGADGLRRRHDRPREAQQGEGLERRQRHRPTSAAKAT